MSPILVVFGVVIAILIVMLLLWAGDRLLALWPGNSALKQVVRIVVIVVVAIWVLVTVAGLFGIPVPLWAPAPRHR
jgi:hypothetical protein